MFNHNELKGRIIAKYGSQLEFAKAFGVSENTFSMKMNNKVRFTTDDIIKIIGMLEIPINEIGLYFFTESV